MFSALVVVPFALLVAGALACSWMKTGRETDCLLASARMTSPDTAVANWAIPSRGINTTAAGSCMQSPTPGSTPSFTRAAGLVSTDYLNAKPMQFAVMQRRSGGMTFTRTPSVTYQPAATEPQQGAVTTISASPAAAILHAGIATPQPVSSVPTLRPSIFSSGAAPATAGVSIPAVFGNPEAAGIVATPEQSQQMAAIADDFTKTVQSSDAAPNTSAYGQVWNAAANLADEIYRQKNGNQAYEAMLHSANTGQ